VILDRAGNVQRDLRRRECFTYDETLSWRDDRTIAFSKMYVPPRIKKRLAQDPGGIYLTDVEAGTARQILRDKEILIDPHRPPW
jgi:hypothetical protein